MKKYYHLLPFNQQQIIEQAKFTYSPLEKAFEKQTKTIEDQGKKQVDALKTLESLKPKEVKSEETKEIDYGDYYIDRMAEIQNQFKNIDFNNLIYFFKDKTTPINIIGFKVPLQDNVINNVTNLYESRQKVAQMFNDYLREKSRRIYESKQGKRLKILTPKQMLKRIANSSCTNKHWQ